MTAAAASALPDLANLFDHPLVGWVLRGTRMIPVTRGRGAARMADDACAALDAGQAVLVYPEGTIVPPGQTRPARPGAGLVALRTSVPVLPIASRGVERRRPRLRRQVTVAIAPPWTCRPAMAGWTDKPAGGEHRTADPACRPCAITHRVADGPGHLVGHVRPRTAPVFGAPATSRPSLRWFDA